MTKNFFFKSFFTELPTHWMIFSIIFFIWLFPFNIDVGVVFKMGNWYTYEWEEIRNRFALTSVAVLLLVYVISEWLFEHFYTSKLTFFFNNAKSRLSPMSIMQKKIGYFFFHQHILLELWCKIGGHVRSCMFNIWIHSMWFVR